MILGIITILLITFTGVNVVSFLRPSKNWLENLSLGFPLGWGLITILIFLLNISGIMYSQLSIMSVSLLTFLVTLFVYGTPKLKKMFISYNPLLLARKSSLLDKALFLLIFTILLIVIINGLYGVVSTWDALTLYDFRARRFVETGYMNTAIEAHGDYFFGYPLFTSLAHTIFYIYGFSSPMLFYALLFISFVIAFYFFLRKITSKTVSLIFTFLVILAPHLFWHSQIAYTNMPYTAFLVLGALLINEWTKNLNRTTLILGTVFTGLSLWTRHTEPFWLSNIAVVGLYGLYKRRLLDAGIALAVFYPFKNLWLYFKPKLTSLVASLPDQTKLLAMIDIQHTRLKAAPISEVLIYLVNFVFRPYIPVFILLPITILIKAIHKRKDFAIEAIITINLIILVVGTYVFSAGTPYWKEIPGSLQRMVMFIPPLILYSTATIFSEFKTKS